MIQVIRRIVRRLAGLPPMGAPQVSPAEFAALAKRLEDMDKGLQDIMSATRAENRRVLERLHAEVDEIAAHLDTAHLDTTSGDDARLSAER